MTNKKAQELAVLDGVRATIGENWSVAAADDEGRVLVKMLHVEAAQPFYGLTERIPSLRRMREQGEKIGNEARAWKRQGFPIAIKESA